MYYRDLETNAKAKAEHDRNRKADALERLDRNRAWNKANKKAQ
jgi:hypothetical protein